MCVFGPSGLSGGVEDLLQGTCDREIPAEPGDVEADGLQRGAEQRVLLETISAAPAVEQFFLHRGQIKFDRAAQQRIDAFEGDRIDVSGVNGHKCREIGLDLSAKANSRQIISQPEFIRHSLPLDGSCILAKA